GGLAANNSVSDVNCVGPCFHGDGYNLLSLHNQFGVITDSSASGNVTVGAASIAGGLVGAAGDDHSTPPGESRIDRAHAAGAVVGGDNSILGGFIGALDVGGTISKSQASGPVTSLGPNSIVAGFIGVNGGMVTDSQTSGAVNGGSSSYVGGFVGVNTNTGTVL